MSQSIKGIVLVLVSALFFSVSGTLQALAPEGATPYVITEIRMLIGGLCLVFWCLLSKKMPKNWTKLPWKTLFICAFFLLIGQLCFFTGMLYLGVAAGAVISIGSAPIFAAIIGFVCFKKVPLLSWYIATALAIVGIVCINGLDINVNRMALIGLLLMDGFTYACYITMSEKLTEELGADTAVMIILILIAIVLSPVLYFFPVAWAWSSLNGVAVSIGIGVLTAGCAFTFLTAGSRLISPTVASTLCLAEPMAAACWGIFLLHEEASVLTLTGIGLILTSIVILVLGQSISEKQGKTCDSR